jgi:hypothetical protein
LAQLLTPVDCAALATLREHAALADCAGLSDTPLTAGKKLEQEAVEVTAVLQQLSPTAKYRRNHCNGKSAVTETIDAVPNQECCNELDILLAEFATVQKIRSPVRALNRG